MQSQELRDISKELQNNLSKLIEKRRNWENHWQQVSDYCLPRKADITKERSPGDKRHSLVFDGTAIHALALLAASLGHAGKTVEAALEPSGSRAARP